MAVGLTVVGPAVVGDTLAGIDVGVMADTLGAEVGVG